MVDVEGKVIFVLGGSLTALAVIRNSYSLSIPVVVFSFSGEIATHSKLAEIVLVNDTDDGAFLSIQDNVSKYREIFLIASSDEWLRFIIKFRSKIDLLDVNILHANTNALDICLNKIKFVNWAVENKFPIPLMLSAPDLNSKDLHDQLKAFPYPLIVRPAITQHSDGCSSLLKAQQIFNYLELEACLGEFEKAKQKPLITQSLIPFQAHQYSVAVARTDNEMRSFVAKKIRPSIEFAKTGSYVSLSPADDVEVLARTVLDKLDYYGIAEVEILKRPDTGELFLIEINARPWLQYMLAFQSNHDFLHFLVDKNSYRRDLECKTGYHWIDFNADFYATFSRSIGAVRFGKIKLWRYLLSLIQANVYACFTWEDIRPFKANLTTLLRLLKGKK